MLTFFSIVEPSGAVPPQSERDQSRESYNNPGGGYESMDDFRQIVVRQNRLEFGDCS